MLLPPARLTGDRWTEEWKRKDIEYMLRAMNAAVAGLRGHQQKLDVIGNNIANVNTVGYKSQSYTFKDTMYQTSTASTNGTDSAGGVNAAQYGYGSLMGTISMDMTGSTATYVGGFQASIDGEGFFVTKVSKDPIDGLNAAGADDTNLVKGGDFDYTRVGNFRIDSNGYMVDGNGNFVYGFRRMADDSGDTLTKMEPIRVPSKVEVNQTGDVTITINDIDANTPQTAANTALEAKNVKINKAGNIEVTIQAEVTDAAGNKSMVSRTVTIGSVAVATFQNQEGLTKDGNGYYKASGRDNTGRCSVNVAGDGRGSLMPGYLEASNVDMAVEFSEMIMAERGFQANSKIITVSDEILSDLINMKR